MNTSLLKSTCLIAVDLGNTRAKIAVFKEGGLSELIVMEDPDAEKFRALNLKRFAPAHAIISSVAGEERPFTEVLPEFSWLVLTHETPLPFLNLYLSPQTLGKDRIAGVAGAVGMFPGRNVLVIDMGTAITYDFVNQTGEYTGGAISPGITTRFRSLNTFTQRLPLIEPAETDYLTGRTTEESIRSGVMNGVRAEIDGIIDEYRATCPGLKIILTGGDCFYFEKKLKNNIFAAPNLVLTGLKQILEHHLEK
jgi:type III pantothenate kinase